MPATERELSHVAEAMKYARDVRDGKVSACVWVQKACQRQLDDLERWKTDGPWVWDRKAADRVCGIVERFPHIKGVWARAGNKLLLQPWQKFYLATIFGWKSREYGTRRYRTAYIEIPRKNAKSTVTCAVGLYLMACDDEPGAHVVAAANTRDQIIKTLFGDAQHMARREAGFRARFGVEVLAHLIAQPATASKFEALAAEDNNLDGLNIHGALIDELHAHRSRGLWDVLETATGSRSQPLIWAITTAGTNKASVCYEQHRHVRDILNRTVEDDTYFGIIYTIDEGDDPFDEASWPKANPNWGVSIYPESIRVMAARAQMMPSAQAAFLTKHLNVWVNADMAWLPHDAWGKCADPQMQLGDFEGQDCYIGIDLALGSDIAATVLLFPPAAGRDWYACFGRYYLPEDTIQRSENTHYQGWEAQGLLTETLGAVTDFDAILDDLTQFLERFRVREIASDPYKNIPLVNHLQQRGVTLPIIDVRPVPGMTTPAMLQMERLVMGRQLRHDGDPIMAWMVSNVTAHRPNPNVIQPRRDSSDRKIDGVMALLTALDRAMRQTPQPDYSMGLVII